MGKVQKGHKESTCHTPPPYPLNSRSCLCCHQRKVRCDRGVPCSNCANSDWPCTYPDAGRDRSRKPPSLQDITERLDRMETLLLRHLEKHSADEQSGTKGQHPCLEPLDIGPGAEKSSSKPWEALLRDGERVQYVNNSNLLDLMPDQEQMRHPPSGPGDSEAQSSLGNFNLNIDVTFPSRSGFSSGAFQSHPDLQLAMRLWSTYVKRVDPVLKVLHIPTTQSIVLETIMDPRSASPSQMALVFAIYFAAVTTLDKNEDTSTLTENRLILLDIYKTGLNQALMQTNFPSKPTLLDLQALAIFLTCVYVLTTLAVVYGFFGASQFDWHSLLGYIVTDAH